MKNNQLILLFLISSFFGVLVSSVSAIEIFPETFHFSGVQGEKIKKKLLLKNESSELVNVHVSFSPMKKDSSPKGKPWLKVSKNRLVLKPRKSKSVQVICKVPRGEGELYGTLLITSENPNGPLVELQTKHQVCLRILGTELSQAKFTNVQARNNNGQIWIEATLENRGNVHLKPKLVAEIENQDKVKMTKIFETPVRTVLPGESTDYSTSVLLEDPSRTVQSGFVTAFFYNGSGGVKSVREPFTIRFDHLQKTDE